MAFSEAEKKDSVANIQALVTRRDGQLEWLKKNYPGIFENQRHLDDGSVERGYWHYGYMVALTDVLKFLGVEGGKDGCSGSIVQALSHDEAN